MRAVLYARYSSDNQRYDTKKQGEEASCLV